MFNLFWNISAKTLIKLTERAVRNSPCVMHVCVCAVCVCVCAVCVHACWSVCFCIHTRLSFLETEPDGEGHTDSDQSWLDQFMPPYSGNWTLNVLFYSLQSKTTLTQANFLNFVAMLDFFKGTDDFEVPVDGCHLVQMLCTEIIDNKFLFKNYKIREDRNLIILF